MRRPRLALAAAAVGLALATSGCAYINPVQTHDFYQAADGTNANLTQGDNLVAGVRNAIVVVSEDGSAVLLGAVANYTDEDITVNLEGRAEGATAFSGSVTVPANSTVNLGVGENAQQVPINQLDVPAGATMDLAISSGEHSAEITLPVTDTSLDYYKDAVENAGNGSTGN